MSPLTKLFVGLLVVLSLLLTASTVTFVNTLDNQRQKAENARQEVLIQKSAADSAAQQAISEKAQADEARQLAQNQVEQLKQRTNEFEKDMAKANVDLAEKSTQLAIQMADGTRLSEALKASEEAKTGLQELVVSLRTANDKALQDAAQASMQINDLQNRLEITERERRNAAEQLEEARGQATKLSNAIQDRGGNPREILASSKIVGGAAPKINGVVRDVRTVAGLPYATISVGSADSVSKGMTFNVVERNGGFLGKITIISVELNEATGRITGPKVEQVKPGVEVKTQL